MAVIGSLSVKLGLVTVEWDKATSQAKKQAKDLQAALNDLGGNMKNLKGLFQQLGGAAGLSAAGMLALSHSVMQMAGNLDDLSKSYDVSIAKVLQFQNAIVQAGGKAEDAGKIMGTMFGKIAEAQQGNEAAIAAFEDLGITFEELRSMNPEQALTRVYQGLANIGNTYDRIKAVKDILGKGGLHKSVEEIAEALGQSTAEFKRQEAALKAWADLGDRIDRMMLNLKLAFAEVFKVFTGGDFIPSVNQFKAAMIAVTSVMVINGMFKLVAAFKALNTALKSTAALGVAIQSAQGIKGIAMAGGALAAYFGAMKVFETQDQEEAAEGGAESQEGGGTPEAVQTGDRRELTAMRAKIALAKKLMDIDLERALVQADGIRGNQYETQLAENQLKFKEDMAKAEQERAEALKKQNLSAAQRGLIEEEFQVKKDRAEQDELTRRAMINQQRKFAMDLVQNELGSMKERINLEAMSANLALDKYKMNSWDYAKAVERLELEKRLQSLYNERRLLEMRTDKESPEYQTEKERIDTAIRGEQELSAIRMQSIEAERYRAETWSEGWNEAFRNFAQQAGEYGKAGAEAFNSVVGNMNSAIDTFVRTGKFAFKDFAKSIIQDLIAIQMKMQAMALFKAAMGWAGFSVPGATGKASGGMVSQGVPYLVGEQGPELFVPQKGGAIVPSNRVGDALMGGGPSVVYNGPYIAQLSAIDTQNATQFLAKNKMAVWSANQSAGRSVPQSR